MTYRTILLACSLLLVAAVGCDSSDPTGADGDAGPDSGLTDGEVPACPHFGQVPAPEECNAFDDDCDGVMDEGVCDDPCDIFDEP